MHFLTFFLVLLWCVQPVSAQDVVPAEVAPDQVLAPAADLGPAPVTDTPPVPGDPLLTPPSSDRTPTPPPSTEPLPLVVTPPAVLPAPGPLPEPQLDATLVADAERADAWIQEMARKEHERRTGGRWMSVIMSGAMIATAGLLLSLDEVEAKTPRWMMGSSIVPFSAAVALGLLLPPERATPWAYTGFALGAATLSTSFCFDWSDRDGNHGTHDERVASVFFGAALASQFLWTIPLAFLDRGVGQQVYDTYFGRPVAARPRAATELLIESDHRTRAKAGVALIAGLLTLVTVSAGAAMTDQPWVLIAGAPTLTSTLSAVIPLLFRDSRLEMFVRGELPRPGVFNF
ncbi:MAG: hypothetical protein QM778_24945 [Myxococcales bacterium]